MEDLAVDPGSCHSDPVNVIVSVSTCMYVSACRDCASGSVIPLQRVPGESCYSLHTSDEASQPRGFQDGPTPSRLIQITDWIILCSSNELINQMTRNQSCVQEEPAVFWCPSSWLWSDTHVAVSVFCYGRQMFSRVRTKVILFLHSLIWQAFSSEPL